MNSEPVQATELRRRLAYQTSGTAAAVADRSAAAEGDDMTAPHTAPARAARHPWAQGLMLFGAVMLMIAGVLDVLRGIMGIAQDPVLLATQGYVFRFDLTGWGWVHVVLGALAVIVSLGLFQSARWARFAGVAVAGLVVIAHFLSLPYSPVWSTLMIALSGLVIWALCVARPADASGAYGTAPRER